MDNQHATVVGHANSDASEFTILGHVKNPGPGPNSSENAQNNLEITLVQKYFKEIGALIVNATEVHVTGTGTIQEQFIRFLSETPQFKNTAATECTSNPMSDQQLVEHMSQKFH